MGWFVVTFHSEYYTTTVGTTYQVLRRLYTFCLLGGLRFGDGQPSHSRLLGDATLSPTRACTTNDVYCPLGANVTSFFRDRSLWRSLWHRRVHLFLRCGCVISGGVKSETRDTIGLNRFELYSTEIRKTRYHADVLGQI